VSRLPQERDDAAGQKLGRLPGLRSLLGRPEGGEGLPWDILCAEDGQDLASNGLDLSGPMLPRVKRGELQRDERRIVPNRPLGEGTPHLFEDRDGGGGLFSL